MQDAKSLSRHLGIFGVARRLRGDFEKCLGETKFKRQGSKQRNRNSHTTLVQKFLCSYAFKKNLKVTFIYTCAGIISQIKEKKHDFYIKGEERKMVN